MNSATMQNNGERKLEDRARMLISCPDRPGIVAAVSQFLHNHGANIVESDQYSMDPEGGLFFIRIVFDLPQFQQQETELKSKFAGVASQFQMKWRLTSAARKKRMAVFVSKEAHCLQELLWQWQAGDLDVEIAMVVSNHAVLQPVVEPFGIPFHHIPVTKETRQEAEQKQIALLQGEVDFVVLARYMQILSADFIQQYPNLIINIHHSFLPAFVGSKPYAQAYERGVKLIGATAHYVTENLDAGPIIEQDVQRVNHRDDVEDLKRIGRHIERVVLARAVNWHIQDRILVHGNKTVVFS
jgi:formyltetrahydrofolate deformylase